VIRPIVGPVTVVAAVVMMVVFSVVMMFAVMLPVVMTGGIVGPVAGQRDSAAADRHRCDHCHSCCGSFEHSCLLPFLDEYPRPALASRVIQGYA
jgi:hypothetical protein